MTSTDSAYRIEQSFSYVADDWWKWSVWIEADDAKLDAVEQVEYTLHTSFRDPVRVVKSRDNKFRLSSEGWGIFTIYCKVFLKDGRQIPLEHDLYLAYPDGTQNTE